MAYLVFIGPMASGKTRLGKRVAKLTGRKFLDTDHLIVDRHGPIADIFAEHGEAHFRELEKEAVAEALKTDAVVSLGGGAVLAPETQELLLEQPTVLLLIDGKAAAMRLALSRKRPLITAGRSSWEHITAERMPIYKQLAKITYDTTRSSFDNLAKSVVDWRKEQEQL